MLRTLSVILLLFLSFAKAGAYDPPTMGWSSWNTYRNLIHDTLIRQQADALVRLGLRHAGYNYVNIDDGAFDGRTPDGTLRPHATRFPNGLKSVVDYIHCLGLKAGTYSDAGRNTCAHFWDHDRGGAGIGLYDHEEQDANYLFKKLGFDFIKVDFCGGDAKQNTEKLTLDEQERYTAIHRAILKTGRHDVRMNICRWAYPGHWARNVATSWRIAGDISNTWTSVKRIVAENLFLSAYATEGHFNDMDMLEVGRGMTPEEDRTHFGLWCIMSSPLLIGCDLTHIDSATLALLCNPELIAINQDTLARQAHVVEFADSCYVLVKDVKQQHGGTRAVAFYNPSDQLRRATVALSRLNLEGKIGIRDLYKRETLSPLTDDSLTVCVPPHGTRIYILTGKPVEPSRYEAENAWLEQYSAITDGKFARIQYAKNLSCGCKVSDLGDGAMENNFMEWRDVYSQDGGNYIVDIAYFSGEDRSLTLTVNGTTPVTLENLNSGGWARKAIVSLHVELKAGSNTIRLSNSKGWAPDIDYIDIRKAKQPSQTTMQEPCNAIGAHHTVT
ncbi:melibiase [Prevotella sp. CAG:755]|nr:melibiase [Prevotella sp. CAG:755]